MSALWARINKPNCQKGKLDVPFIRAMLALPRLTAACKGMKSKLFFLGYTRKLLGDRFRGCGGERRDLWRGRRLVGCRRNTRTSFAYLATLVTRTCVIIGVTRQHCFQPPQLPGVKTEPL